MFLCVIGCICLCIYFCAFVFLCICFRPSWSLCREDAAAVLGAKEEWGQRPATPTSRRTISWNQKKKTFAFIILMSFLSEPSPIHALYFCSCFAFLSNGDEERGAAAKLAELIGKTDHEDGKKEIFLFILHLVSVFFWELFQYLNA